MSEAHAKQMEGTDSLLVSLLYEVILQNWLYLKCTIFAWKAEAFYYHI